MKKLLGGLLIVVLTLFIAGVVFLYWAHLGSSRHETFIKGDCASGPRGVRDLTVLTYNIAGGRGPMKYEMNLHDVPKIENILNKIANLFKEVNADIVLLQEVDLLSDHAKYIADRAGYSCYACITNLVKNYIPYPFWPPSSQVGKVKGGMCILSKYPITNNIRIPLPQREDVPFYYRAFYYDDAIQRADIEVENSVLAVFNVHLEGYDIANRDKQAKILVDHVHTSSALFSIIGGDFNTIPQAASLKKGFPDVAGTPWQGLDFTADKTMEYIRHALSDHSEAIAGTFTEDGNFTFPASAPNRRVDYIFLSNSLEELNGSIIDPGTLSDHLPVYVKLALPQAESE